jgi:hypothetical protein
MEPQRGTVGARLEHKTYANIDYHSCIRFLAEFSKRTFESGMSNYRVGTIFQTAINWDRG